jgi:hypothetical protein
MMCAVQYVKDQTLFFDHLLKKFALWIIFNQLVSKTTAHNVEIGTLNVQYLIHCAAIKRYGDAATFS